MEGSKISDKSRADNSREAYRLLICGPVVSATADAGTFTLTVRTGSLEHQLTLRATSREGASLANAFVYAQEGDVLSLDFRGEHVRCSLSAPDGQSFTTSCFDDPD